MVKPAINDADLRRAHRAMRIATPFDAMSDLLRTTLAAAARAMASCERQRATRRPVGSIPDLKRRAAGDFDD
ncbi:hypothetical protein [Cupriavidus taiwanensis]|uniref:Uncharacterized protein n=1 Tax=Cupriavidus taiwanensis (strain DSM 17343 / BCRC 17206 / CCUG 44338 / CIP 107171 / LMG 19424 / R1) TaxID=977880 RepID=B3R3H9_CUPTR|nr:hypothetical protein [Cupriavidus taiwanensis]CAQ68860.1 conserved hypothetical protein [Cupriavidus taiwanensis LMG 19424]